MRPRIIVIGTSLGGLNALGTIFRALPREFAIPIAVVQHRGEDSGELLIRELRRYTELPIREPFDKEPISSGCVYVAPANYHLLLEPGEFRLSTEGPVSYARPSIDVLFESAAYVYGNEVAGVILTGANSDGARGAVSIKRAGGTVIVQNTELAECPIMPQATLNLIKADHILTLSEISSHLLTFNSAQH